MQLLGVLCCFCLVVQYSATEIESSSQGSGIIISSEHGFKPEQPSEERGYMRNEVVPPGPMVQLLVRAARNGSEQSTGRTGASEVPRLEEESVVGNDQPDGGDPRSKRSPHRYRKGCFSCGYGGGGFYVEPVYVKPIRIQPVYVKTVEYVQPVYQKPVYSQPHYGSGCSTCGQWGGGGGGGSYAYSQSSASSFSSSYGYGRK